MLSEFAGAAEELRHGALLVNPHDAERVASVLCLALAMEESEQRVRMEIMRSHVKAHDIFHWSQLFISQAAATSLDITPAQVPRNLESLRAAIGH